MEKRRKYLVDFAKQNSFDPSIESNWTSPSIKKLFVATKVRQISQFYSFYFIKSKNINILHLREYAGRTIATRGNRGRGFGESGS